MKVLKKSRFNQRVTHFALAGLMLLSMLAAAGPFIFSNKADAISGATYSNVDLTTGWVTDRTAPSGGSGVVSFQGRSSLEINVDAPSTASSFYRYEGLQKSIPISQIIKADLYVDGSWTSNARAGFWGVGYNSAGALSAYPIIEYNKAEGGWRVYDSSGTGDGAWRWTNLSSEIPANINTWNTLELAINVADPTRVDAYINGEYAFFSKSDPTTNLRAIILQNYNSGTDDYSVHWSNIQAGSYNPAAPTNLSISKNGSNVSNGSHVNASFVNGNISLNFDPVNDAHRYITEVTYPGGSTQVWNSNNNTWLVKNGVISQGEFAAHGDGEYSYKVKTRAANGLESGWSQPVSLVYDTKAPTSIVTANGRTLPENTSADPVVLLAGEQTTFQAALTDELSTPDGAYIELFKADYLGNYTGGWVTDNTQAPGSVRHGANPKLVYNTSALSGRYGLKIVASDNIGNSVTKYYFFTIDNTIPSTPVINTPDDEQYFTTTPILNEWTASTDANGISKYQIEYIYDDGHTFSGAPYREVNGSTTSRQHSPSTSEQGGVKIRVRAQDGAGNYSAWSNQVHYYYDAIPPTAPEVTAPNVAYLNGSSTLNAWNPATDASGIAQYEVKYELTTDTKYRYTTNTQRTQTFSGSYQGPITLSVRAQDKAGNWGPYSTNPVTYYYDSIDPVINLFAETIVGNDATVDITATTDDAVSYELFIDGVQVAAGQTPFTVYAWDTTGLASKTYTVSMKATDVAGNDATASIDVEVDNDDPVVVIATSYTTVLNTVIPDVNATDAHGPLTYNWTPNDTASATDVDISNQNASVPTFTVKANGTYSFTLTTTDAFGNATDEVFAFLYSAPAVTQTVVGSPSLPTPTPTPTPTPAPTATPTFPTFTNPAAVLGTTTTGDGATEAQGASDVEGATDDKTAAIDTDATDGSIFNLAWYWWVLIVGGLAALIGWLIAAARRRTDEAS